MKVAADDRLLLARAGVAIEARPPARLVFGDCVSERPTERGEAFVGREATVAFLTRECGTITGCSRD